MKFYTEPHPTALIRFSLDPHRLSRVIRLAGIALLPSFIQRRLSLEPSSPHKARDASALDGLRGLACLLVFSGHLTFMFTDRHFSGWHSQEGTTYIPQFYFIRILLGGRSLVAVFLTISGYVLSERSIKQMHAKSAQSLYKTLASGTFRRGIRLYVPCIVATFICLLLVRAGAFDYPTRVKKAGALAALSEDTPQRYPSFWLQFVDWSKQMARSMDIWDWTSSKIVHHYDPHLWTIPVIFRASMLLFLTQLATARLKAQVRVTIIGLMIVYCIRSQQAHEVLFFAGMLLAEVDILSKKSSSATLPSISSLPSHQQQSVPHWAVQLQKFLPIDPSLLSHLAPAFLFLLSIHLLCTPIMWAENTFSYKILMRLTSDIYPDPLGGSYFLQELGAVILIYCVNNSPPESLLHRSLCHAVPQYLSKISFSLYIIHGNVIRSIGYGMMPWVWQRVAWLGSWETQTGFGMAWLLEITILCPLVLWIADLFWRGVDMPSARFTKWIEGMVEDESWNDTGDVARE